MYKKMKVLIIGAGQISAGYDSPDSDIVLTHAKAVIRSDEFELVGFYDVNKEAAREAAVKWQTRVIDDVSDIGDIDVVCCAVPDKYHYDIMMMLSQWNNLKAVICEKPLADTYERACKIREIYDELNTAVFVNYTRRYLQEFIDLKEWIDAQAGPLITGHCIYGKGSVHNCSHMINLLQYLVGEICLDRVFGTVYDYLREDPSAEFVLQSGEAEIVFQVVPCNVATVFEFDLIFEGGRIKYDDAEGRIDYYIIQDSKDYPGYENYYQYKSAIINRNRAIQLLYTNVCDVIMGESDFIRSDMNAAVETLKMCRGITERIMES